MLSEKKVKIIVLQIIFAAFWILTLLNKEQQHEKISDALAGRAAM